MKSTVLILIFCLVPMIMVTGQEQQAKKLLSEAIYQEEVNGDLNKALKTYQQILEQYSDNRNACAEALLHLGMCHEKLGNQEAVKTYNRLVNNYPEQKNEVAIARERLSRLIQAAEKVNATEPEGIRIKQIWKEPLLDDLGTVSYDGRFRSYVDWGEGDVAVQDLITGEKKKLTNKASVGGDTESFALGTAISKNGKLIASSWSKPYNTTNLIIVDVENLSMNNIYSQLGEEVYPAAWLSDKELVATRWFPEKNIIQIVSFKIQEKTPKILKSFEKWQNLQLACSPDEKYIAYNFANNADNGNSDINLLSAEGDKDIPLIRHSANDKVLGWVPGRKEFLFVSDRSGT